MEASKAREMLDRILEAGAVPCGLGARDTLRLEAGLALWGSDIDATTTPLEAGLDFAVDWDHDFTGRAALERQRDEGVDRRLTGLVMGERGIPRHGYRVRSGSSEGEVTSGNLSPVLDKGIALAYLSPPVEVGAPAVEVVASGVTLPHRGRRVGRPRDLLPGGVGDEPTARAEAELLIAAATLIHDPLLERVVLLT